MPVKRLEEDAVSNGSAAEATAPVPDVNAANDNSVKTAGKQPVIKWKTANVAKKWANDDPLRFEGNGLDFKAKLIGVQDVVEARGDQMCQEAMMAAKAMVKSSGQHKHRIVVNVSIEGIKIKDEKAGQVMHSFPVHKVSFIARDTSDTRAFGFVYGTPENKHKFYGIKTEQKSDLVVLAIRDMFHVVYEMKKRQIEDVKRGSVDGPIQDVGKLTDQNANHTKEPAVDNLLDLEEAFEGMKENLGQMSSWEAFDSSSNSESGGSGGLAKGSSFSSTQPTSDFSQSGHWSVNSLLNDSSGDPFADVVNKSSSSPKPVGILQQPQSLQNDLQQLYSLQQETPVADPFAAIRQAQQNPFESAGLGSLPTPHIQYPTQVFVSPPVNGVVSHINSTGGDPFDTSHVSQMLKQTSTPQHASGALSGFGVMGVNVSQQPSAIRADSTGNDSFFGSNSVFNSNSGAGMTSNLSPGQGVDSLNQALSESKFQSELFGVSSSSPLLLTPLRPNGPASSPGPVPTPQYQKPPASVEEGLGVLCDIHNLDLSVPAGPKRLLPAKTDPFSTVKNPPKPTINELLTGQNIAAAPRPFDMSQFAPPPAPMHQSASTPVFTVGSPPGSNPFVTQQPAGISTPVAFGSQSWNSSQQQQYSWMTATSTPAQQQPPLGFQTSMGFSGDFAAPPVVPRSAGKSAALPPPIQATNFLSGSAQKSQIACGSGPANPFADDFFK